MGLFHWANAKIRILNAWDIGLLKIVCILAGMILGAYLSSFIIRNIVWLAAAAVVLTVAFMIRFLKSRTS
jgi:putative Mn2+ efflux pump MntP